MSNKFSDHFAMNYEYLIRRAHQCGRYGVAGANADTYRGFLRNASMYYSEMEAIKNKKPRHSTQSEEGMLSDYMCTCGEVKAYIMTAIDTVKRKYEVKLSDDQYNELENIEVLLIKPNLEKITESIERAEKVMLGIELFPQ